MKITFAEKQEDLPQYSSLLNDEILLGLDTPSQFKSNCIFLVSYENESVIYSILTEEMISINYHINATLHLENAGFTVVNYCANRELIELLQIQFNIGFDEAEDQANAQKRFDRYIQTAIDMRASDIHFRINENNAQVLYRVDGDLILKEESTPDVIRVFLETHYTSFSGDQEKSGYSDSTPLSSTAEGRFILRRPYIEIDGEFTAHYVHVKVRKQSDTLSNGGLDEVWRLIITDNEARLPTYEELGFLDHQIEILDRAINAPRGLTLFCGTTGSGKSTGLATSLGIIYSNSGGRKNIRSVENPVEYTVKGVRQKSISSRSDYAESIRVAMRLDPDVLSIGEIIDKESAHAAADFSLSGHSTLSTLHAGTPLNAIKRLEAFGVDPLTLGEKDFINAIVVQTLIQKLCDNCKVEFEKSIDIESSAIRHQFDLSGLSYDGLYGRGCGCEKCFHRGVSGRTVIANVVSIDEKMRDFMGQGKYLEAFKGTSDNYFDHASYLMKKGIVSPLAVYRQCGKIQ